MYFYPYSQVLISLLKGVVYENNTTLWKDLLNYENDIKKYFEIIGLSLYVDKTEGFAFLRQIEQEEEEQGNYLKLIEKRQLSYPVTVLLVLLRKCLLEADSSGSDTRVILEKEKIRDMLKMFLPDTTNEVRSTDKIDECINKVTDFGFLRKLKTNPNQYEINRIIKAKISAELLQGIEQELISYARAFN